MFERFGVMSFKLGLTVEHGKLNFPVLSGRCLGVPIPKALLPRSEASETERDGRLRFDVKLKSPTGTLLVHYRGALSPILPEDTANTKMCELS